MKTLITITAFLLAFSSCTKTMPHPCPDCTTDPDPDPIYTDPYYGDPGDDDPGTDPAPDPGDDDPGYDDPGSGDDPGSCSTNHSKTTVHYSSATSHKLPH